MKEFGKSKNNILQGPSPRYPDYVSERQRLDSFEHWPISSPTQNQLADAGFFFTNQADLVRCFQCGIGLKDFSAADDPLLEHVRHSGDCSYLLLYLGEEKLTDMKSQLQTTVPDYNRQLQWNNRHNAGMTTRYRHPEYQTFEARLATFRRWPSNIGQTPTSSQLADAGLYYTGFEDHVRCFACDGGLRQWDAEDDPWTEHCRWFPACPYCIEQKGEEYIALVQALTEQFQLQTPDPHYNRQLQRNKRHNARVTTRYRHPEYQTYEARLATFRKWYSTPEQLAAAGLYYTGFDDLVRCFACDGSLRRWEPKDDPWTEHCRWFPTCRYCIEQKGEKFIAMVQATAEQDHLGASSGGASVNIAEQEEKEAQAFYNTTKAIFDDMGFQEADVKVAVLELCNRESLLEQNRRLKSMIYCCNCQENVVNALFLPCTHLELCMECAEPLIVCPLCKRDIREKIRTSIG